MFHFHVDSSDDIESAKESNKSSKRRRKRINAIFSEDMDSCSRKVEIFSKLLQFETILKYSKLLRKSWLIRSSNNEGTDFGLEIESTDKSVELDLDDESDEGDDEDSSGEKKYFQPVGTRD